MKQDGPKIDVIEAFFGFPNRDNSARNRVIIKPNGAPAQKNAQACSENRIAIGKKGQGDTKEWAADFYTGDGPNTRCWRADVKSLPQAPISSGPNMLALM